MVSMATRERVSVSIVISHSFQIILLPILKKQLMLSAAEIKRLVESGQISGVTMKMLKSRKLKSATYEFQLATETLYARRRIALIRR